MKREYKISTDSGVSIATGSITEGDAKHAATVLSNVCKSSATVEYFERSTLVRVLYSGKGETE